MKDLEKVVEHGRVADRRFHGKKKKRRDTGSYAYQ